MTEYRQTSISAQAQGFHGQIADRGNPYIDMSRAAEEEIAFGLIVGRGSDTDKQVAIGGATPFGVAVRSQSVPGVGGVYGADEAVRTLRQGFVFLELETAASAGDALNYNSTTGVIDAGAASAGEIDLPGEVVEVCAGSGAIALCYVDCISPAASVGAIELITDTFAFAHCEDLALQTDEDEVSADLNGVDTKSFVPTHVIVKVISATGTVAADATLNVGTTTGGAEILSAAAVTGLDTADEMRMIPVAALTAAIDGDATIYANVESKDATATTLVVDVYVCGRQF